MDKRTENSYLSADILKRARDTRFFCCSKDHDGNCHLTGPVQSHERKRGIGVVLDCSNS